MSIRIGIRPIIDGRGKVRDQLEEKTMNMARAAQKLIQSRVRGRDGLPAESVVYYSRDDALGWNERCIVGIASPS